MRILIIEDNKSLSALMVENLQRAGIKAEQAYTGEQAIDILDPETHDLVILDRGLPDTDGLSILGYIRKEGLNVPVLILTAMDDLGDKVKGLNSGADDYLVKPFEMDELIARIRALYRRPANAVDVVLELGNVSFSSAENVVKIGGREINFSNKEKVVLARLLRLPGRVVGKNTLENALYGHGEEGSQNSVEVMIHRLRKKLDEASASAEIHTLRGIGYLMKQKP